MKTIVKITAVCFWFSIICISNASSNTHEQMMKEFVKYTGIIEQIEAQKITIAEQSEGTAKSIMAQITSGMGELPAPINHGLNPPPMVEDPERFYRSGEK
jgi:hypothetical protein